MKKAIILGITGLTGGILAHKLLKDPAYGEVISFHRRPSGIKHPKLTEHVVDLFSLEEESDLFKGDVVFCCVGTTQAKTPDKETYHKIDYGIPVSAAQLAHISGINKFIAISALGSDPESRIFYNRTKGEMERDVLKTGVPEKYLLQPALIAGDREEKRMAEYLAKQAMKVVNYLLVGPLKKYRSIHPETIATAMHRLAITGYDKERIPSDEIKKLANENA